jgi:hypothetical protein
MEKPRLIREIEGEIARATHRRYVINLELLDVTSLREFERLLRDLTTEKKSRRPARLTPFRQG